MGCGSLKVIEVCPGLYQYAHAFQARRPAGSNPGRTSSQGLIVFEEKGLPLH